MLLTQSVLDDDDVAVEIGVVSQEGAHGDQRSRQIALRGHRREADPRFPHGSASPAGGRSCVPCGSPAGRTAPPPPRSGEAAGKGEAHGAFLEVHDFRLSVERPVRSPAASARRRPSGECYGCAHRRSTYRRTYRRSCACPRACALARPSRPLPCPPAGCLRRPAYGRLGPVPRSAAVTRSVELVPGGDLHAVPCPSAKCSRWTAAAGGDEVWTRDTFVP